MTVPSGSSIEERYPALAQLLGAYFHQDWDLDDPNADAVVRRFLRSESAETVRRAREDVAHMLSSTRTDAQLEAMTAQLGSIYLPTADGLTTRAWLTRIGEMLAAEQPR